MKQLSTKSEDRINALDAIIAFITPTIFLSYLYLYTAFPSIPGGDSAELISEACVGGVAHPVLACI